MYNNIGKKIKSLAKVICFIGIAVSCLVGFIIIIGGIGSSVTLSTDGISPALAGVGVFGGVIYAIVGSLASWLGTFLLYGFGHLVDMQEQSALSLDELCALMRRKNNDYSNASNSAVPPSAVAKTPAWKIAEAQAAAKQEEKPAEQTKSCPICGCKLSATSAFCPQCGTKI